MQQQEVAKPARKLSSPDELQLVRDLARPWGIKWVEAEGVSMCVGLPGTGGDPAPSSERGMLLSDMQKRNVENPESVLASPSTALCLVRAILPPGAQEGDRIDIEVRIPRKSNTTSLENGWVMQARLKEYARLNNRLASGHELAICRGDILIDSLIEGTDDPVMKTRGRILGGGVVTKSRELGLRVRDEHLSVRTSARIGDAINQRFHVFSHGRKTGVATPKKDSFIQLTVHPRYKENLARYIRVIESIPVRENSSDLVNRMKGLKPRLLDPATSSQTSVQLEAIGPDAVSVLQHGLESSNPEVRFYSAEALAYLNHESAAAVLGDSIRREPAFRWRAFQALSAMEDMAASDELARLLHDESAETRYAAFRTIRNASPNDPLIQGDRLGERFYLHRVDSSDEMVHISKDERAEIVLFGRDFALAEPIVLFTRSHITVRDTVDGRVKVKRLSTDEDGDRQLVVDANLEQVIRAVVELGGKYADVVNLISQAQANGCLDCRVAYSALPKPGRKYDRSRNSERAEVMSASELARIETGNEKKQRPMARGKRASSVAPVVHVSDLDQTRAAEEAREVNFDGIEPVEIQSETKPPLPESLPTHDEIQILDDDMRDVFLFDKSTRRPLPDSAEMVESAALVESFGP